ncbi:MAG: hypothetical protein U5K31_03145 [Balneolaceae bacterium]|nr:hypothetical protein [Balneolaceae bacterium]
MGIQRTAGNVLKIWLAGFVASLVMFVFIFLGVHVTGLAPFNVAPSAAFLYNIGVEVPIYAVLLHFAYGILWGYVLVFTFEDDLTVSKALGLSMVLWLFMMVVYSPLIGWGIFGYGYAHLLSPGHPLFLQAGLAYVSVTLVLHLVYGAVLGLATTRQWLLESRV